MRSFVLSLVVLGAVATGLQAQDCSTGRCVVGQSFTRVAKAPVQAVQTVAQATRKTVTVVARPVQRIVAVRPLRRLFRCR